VRVAPASDHGSSPVRLSFSSIKGLPHAVALEVCDLRQLPDDPESIVAGNVLPRAVAFGRWSPRLPEGDLTACLLVNGEKRDLSVAETNLGPDSPKPPAASTPSARDSEQETESSRAWWFKCRLPSGTTWSRTWAAWVGSPFRSAPDDGERFFLSWSPWTPTPPATTTSTPNGSAPGRRPNEPRSPSSASWPGG
jgi:hypothetical protein